MIYDNAVDQAKGMRQQPVLPLRLAKVTSIDNGRAYVQFYGESSASTKLYPYLAGYKPTVGDDVLMIQQGSTFIIAGKVSKDNIVDNYYLLKSAADALYLTEAAADAKYQPKGDVYQRKIQNNSYWFGFNSDTSKSLYGYHLTSTSPDPIELGTTSNKIGAVYATTIGGTSSNNSIQTFNVKDTNVYGNIIPNTTNSSNIGSSSSKQFNNVYAKQFYQNGTAISTSDRRKKKSIKDITKKYVDFFRKLRPRTFLFKKGESGRTHCGFIAQEVEEAAGECGIDSKELAFLCIDKDGGYGLRYEELIAIQTKIIQDLLSRVEALEDRVNGGKANDK